VLLALRRDARSVFFRSRGGAQVDLQLQLAINLYRPGHYGNACSVDAVADLFGVSVGAVVKSSRRVVKALVSLAPVHIRWPNAQRREQLSSYETSKFGFQGCIGATDGTTFPLAYQPALHPWTYYDRKSRYSLSGLITCDWDCSLTNVVVGCTGAAPDTFVQALAEWSEHSNIFFSAGQYLLADKGMLYTRHVIGPFKRPECKTAAGKNYNYQLARLPVKSEHTIGILKGRWGSLKELQVGLASDAHFSFAMEWIVAFCVLHNVCVARGDAFTRQPLADPSPSAIDDPEAGALPMRLQVQNVVCAFMREKGIYRAHVR